ncbi:MAG: hypothetical protein HPY76_07405 [Anaerolineae bacterium]|nr:hypothetical protein [Anaerolineae bacterium]
MQTCSQCLTQVHDSLTTCPNCQADLTKLSVNAVSRQRLVDNPRVQAVRINISHDACPACQAMEGVYNLDEIPTLPVAGCSHPGGCRCTYSPILEEIFP